MQDFMKDRYGVDDLTIALGGISIILALIGTVAKVGFLSWIALALILLALARAFSRNIEMRRTENLGFLRLASKLPVVGPHFAQASRQAAAAGPTVDMGRAPHRRAHVARARHDAVLPLQGLRRHPLRPARQGHAPRHLPQVRSQDREAVVGTPSADNPIRHPRGPSGATARIVSLYLPPAPITSRTSRRK